MTGSVVRQASLFSFAFFKEAAAIRLPQLDAIDELLEDPPLIALVRQALERRWAHSKDLGRPSIAPDRLLRCLVLKHLKGWSFRQLEEELRGSLVYRRFTRFYEDSIPNFSNFSRAFALLDPEQTRRLHCQVLHQAQERKQTEGKKLRSDTTAVETNIHHPSDSSLLADSARVLTRCLRRIAAACPQANLQVLDHDRAIKHRLLEIWRAAKGVGTHGRGPLEQSYGKLLALTAEVSCQASSVLSQLVRGELTAFGDNLCRLKKEQSVLCHYLPLVERVIAQTQIRIFGGQTHYPHKILSLFEPHSVVIRKGKAHRPNEFGRLVRIDEVENSLVSNYQVAEGNPADQTQWVPALQGHQELFGHPPELAAADRGFWSSANERAAVALGVKHPVLPSSGGVGPKRRQWQRQRWFRRGQRWRIGIEARISTLKHRFGMRRAVYKGEMGFERHIGWCVIAHNLVAMTRAKSKPGGRRCRGA